MLRDQMISLLETMLVVLMLTNALSIAAAAYAISLARGIVRTASQPATDFRLLSFLARCLRMRA